MHRKLHLHHTKHTGKLIHHRHTSYWALVLIVALAASVVLFIDRSARADTLQVAATVPAPMPSGAPVITEPTDGSHTTTASVTFRGTCPVITPAIIVVLYRETEQLGSSVCDADGTFAITATLQSGTQTVFAQVMTFTGQVGDSSTPMTVTYAPPVAPGPTAPTTDTTEARLDAINNLTALGSPLFIQLESPFVAYRPGLSVTIRLSVSGGSLPYDVTIAWGDGTVMTRSVESHDFIAFSHRYQTNDVRSLTIKAVDKNGSTLVRTYAVVNVTPSSKHFTLSAAGILDTFASERTHATLLFYSVLLTLLCLLWRYEHMHFRQRVGLPMHYPWQRKKVIKK